MNVGMLLFRRGPSVVCTRGLIRQASSSGNGGRLREYDVCVVGGGIVGLATAREAIIRHPHLTFCLVEKEKELCKWYRGVLSLVIVMLPFSPQRSSAASHLSIIMQ